MRTPASIARHPVHPMLIGFPVTFFTLAPILDLVAWATGDAMWARITFWDITLGIVTALAAAVPGFIDYLSLRGPAARTATYHMILNLIVVGMFGASLVFRGNAAQTWSGESTWAPFAFALGGTLILMVSGWLGGRLAYIHRVGVDETTARDIEERRRAA